MDSDTVCSLRLPTSPQHFPIQVPNCSGAVIVAAGLRAENRLRLLDGADIPLGKPLGVPARHPGRRDERRRDDMAELGQRVRQPNA
jgi:hypothetical protein